VLAARAGYDPYGLVAVLQTLENVDPKSNRMQLLLATHPSPQDRIAALAKIQDGMDQYGADGEGDERFLDVIKQLAPAASSTATPVAATVKAPAAATTAAH
jgi:predicted Zn-dependent protease